MSSNAHIVVTIISSIVFLSGGYVFWKEAGSDESVFSLLGGYVILTIPVTIIMGSTYFKPELVYVNFFLLILVGMMYTGEMVWNKCLIESRYSHSMDFRLWIQEQQ